MTLIAEAVRVARDALVGLHHRRVRLRRAPRVVTALARLVGSAGSLLDVGAHDGRVALALGAAVGATRVEGVDVQRFDDALIPVTPYDGGALPFDDGAFDVVVLSDVLHHAEDPRAVLVEALRVARVCVAVKDHFKFGRASELMLLALDRAGNAGPAVAVRGTYLSPLEWTELVAAAGGRFRGLVWPLQVHDEPIRRVTRDELQFAARIERAGVAS